MSNTYLKFFLEDSYRNQIYTVSTKDKNSGYKNNLTMDYPIFNGFLDFSKDMLQLSAVEIVQYATSNNDRIADLLYSPIYQDNVRKQEWIEFFKPVLKTDFHFYQQCLKICLLTHISNKINIYDSSDSYRQYHLENNEKTFHDLVQIGKNSNFFSNIPHENLFTENKDYQLYLEKENLFKNNFTAAQLIEECLLGEENRLRKYLSSVTQDTMQALVEQPEIIEEIFSTEPNTKPNKVYNSKIPELLLNILFNNNFVVNKEEYETFLINLLQHPTIKSHMLKSRGTILILDSYPNLLIPFLDTLNNEEKKGFYHDTYGYKNYEGKGIGLIKHMYNVMGSSEIVNKIYPIEIIDYIYKNLISGCALNPNVLDMETIGRRKSLAQVMKDQILKGCSQSEVNNRNIDNDLIFTKQNFDKYSSVVIDNFQLNEKKSSDNLNQLKISLKKIDSRVRDKFLDKIVVKIQDELFQMFKPQENYQEKTSEIQQSYDINQNDYILSNLVLFVQYFNRAEVLDILRPDPEKPRWSEINLDVTEKINNNKSTKFIADIPLSFYLIKKSNCKLLSWFTQEENLLPLSTITYKGKKLMSYYKNDKELFTSMVKEIVLDPDQFSLLLEKVKPALQVAKELNDSEVNKAIGYHELQNKVNKHVKNEPIKVTSKMKI